MRIATTLALISLIVLASAASPARASEAQKGVELMMGTIASGCRGMDAEFRRTPGMGAAMSARPEGAFCECVEKRLEAMPLVAELRGMDDAKLEALIEQSTFKDYLVTKLSATLFTCVTDELNAGADAIKPEM